VKGRFSRKTQETSFRDTSNEAHDVGAATPKAPRTSRPSRNAFVPAVRRDPPVEAAADPEFEGDLDREDFDPVDYDVRQEPDPEAQFAYGRMLAEGTGVAPDLEEARLWYVRAAESGLPDAQVAWVR
jgi:hypothetical protein